MATTFSFAGSGESGGATCPNPHPLHSPRVCFSFAAYSKSIITHLRSRGIPIAAGLSEIEFAEIESIRQFKFPPDLRSVLREGLPVGPGFPDWRSASPNQLQILLSLPISGLIREISRPGSDYWPPSWGRRPNSQARSIETARFILSGAAQLVPVYRRFYIAANPNLAGNPLFYIRGADVRCCGFDLADFYRREQNCFSPAWAAKEPRRVDVWSDLAGTAAFSGDRIGRLMEEMGRILREGGWGEEEVREMMMDGGDEVGDGDRTVVKDREEVLSHVRDLARVMLRAGWSREDVVYAMGPLQRHVDRQSDFD